MRSESGMPEETDVIFKADFSDGRVGFLLRSAFAFFAVSINHILMAIHLNGSMSLKLVY